MKRLIVSVAMIGLLSVSAQAGVMRFTAKHVVKPVAKATYKGAKFIAVKVIY